MRATRTNKVLLSLLICIISLAGCGRSTNQGNIVQNISTAISEVLPTQGPSDTPAPTATETPLPSPTPLPQPTFPDPAAFTWALVAEGFQRPLLLTNAADGSGRLFVVGQNGLIWVVENGVTLADPFLDIVSQVGSSGNEQGLLGLAFHPDYQQNGSFYVNYTDVNGDTVISRFQVSSNPNQADPSSETILLQVDQPYPNHNGGHLEFGPDGYLYFGLGDGGSGGDPLGNGQSLDTLLGKLLRVDVNSATPYGIPPDNPFANGGGLPEIWAYGLRNPWRFSFDAATGDLYIADVGQGEWEEVDYLPGGIAGGENFGWNYFEGNHPYQGTPPEGVQLINPITEYRHEGRCSVTGGYVYRGAMLPQWQGVYIYGDYCSGEVFGLLQNPDGAWESRVLYQLPISITSFGLDENGEIYVVDRGGGVYQLQATQ